MAGEKINIYCDESCHLEHDDSTVMAIGAIWCPTDKVKSICSRIKEIKAKNNTNPLSEIKWSKVGPVKEQLYLDLIDYFFDDDDLHFRVVVIQDKSKLDHEQFHQTHDEFYYKTYFLLLREILSPLNEHIIYLDIKDTLSNKKILKLWDVCSNAKYDFNHQMIKRIQTIRSHESQLLQLADVLIGAVGYINRLYNGENLTSKTKQKLLSRIIDRSGYKLIKKTFPTESKFNIFLWDGGYNGTHQ